MSRRAHFNKFIYLFLLALVSCSPQNKYTQYKALPLYEDLMQSCENLEPTCVIKQIKSHTKGLCINDVKMVNAAYWQQSRKQQPLPNFKKAASPPTSLAVKDILFMQQSASLPYQNLKNDIIDLAKSLKSKKISARDIPPIEVWQDANGHIWSTNHRRLIAMILSEVPRIPVTWADKKTVLQNNYEFTTTSGGKIINVWITDNVAMVVENNGVCKNRWVH